MSADEKSLPRTGPRRMLDRYELIAEIARGGMGSVMLARVEGAGGFQRLFAIKLMHPHLAEDRQFIAMLLDEARLAARIHHPNVVATVDVCESKLGYYLVMDYIEGFTLAHILAHETLPARERIRLTNRILLDAMAGLDAAHNLKNDEGEPLGIVHRDVSPQNILIGLDGVGRITDFGVALAASRITSSRPGIIKGKPAYMAPEQARGDGLDRRTDLFALGVILWEALTNSRLFVADSDAGTVYKVIHGQVARPGEVSVDAPAELEPICMKALERDREKRPRSAREMAGELEDAAERAGLLATSHELADRLQELFAREISERRASIREHMQALAPGSAPIVASDVFDMPRLRQHAPGETMGSEPKGSWHETPDGAPLAATRSAKTPQPDLEPAPTRSEKISTGGSVAAAHPVGSAAAAGAPSSAGVSASGTSARTGTAAGRAGGPSGTPPGTSGRILTPRVYLIWGASVLLAMALTVWLVAHLASTGDVAPPEAPPPVATERMDPLPPATVTLPATPAPPVSVPSNLAPIGATPTTPEGSRDVADHPAGPRPPHPPSGGRHPGTRTNLDTEVEENPYLHH